MPSPTASRAPGRRREASESYPFPSSNTLASPTTGFNREDQRAASPPPALQRRRTDLKDAGKAEEVQKDGGDKSATTPFGTLKRQTTGPMGGFGAPASPWTAGTPTGSFSPMGSAFGNFNLANQQGTPGAEKRAGVSGGRQESRFKGLLNKDSNEDMGGTRSLKEKGSVSSLGKVSENDPWRQPERQDLSRAPLEEAEEDTHPSGSAALAAESDLSPSKQRQVQDAFGTPSRGGNPDDFGFGAFGMHPENASGFGQGFGGNAYQQTPSQSRGGVQAGGNDPMSPTDTNPYRSPEQQGLDQLRGEMDNESNSRLPGLGGFGGDAGQQHPSLSGLGGLPPFARGAQALGGDRSQTSSTGPNRGFPAMSGFGGFGQGGSSMWPVSQGGLGTPGRQTAGLSNAFGSGIFGSMGEVQSPSLAGLGGNSVMSPGGNAFGGSRMASMFPPAMQEQMRQQDDHEQGGPPHFPGLGRDVPREGESPFQAQGFNDLLRGAQRDSISADPQGSQAGAPGQQAPIGRQLGQQVGQAPQPGSSASTQPPAPQQRTMVMPDRMRWIYRDPQGQTQGPWSGLEMHDWYKAGFFSPELLVKKYEDPEYEPLAQLIRRIGNSREPFLVPQIGIPHGPAPPTNQGPSAWPASTGPLSAGSTSSGGGGAQPPFASSFPSFGTTLTADQQNALERRKQEEQYLMARQKEHLAQAQIAQRLQMGGAPSGGLAPSGSGQLHHQGSAQSLHSQPSFSSMTSPSAAAYQPSPSQGPSSAGGSGQVQGFFDNSFRAAPGGGLGAVGAGVDSLGHITEEDIPGIMDRLNLGGQQNQFGAPGQGIGQQQQQQQQPNQEREQQVRQMLQDRARLQQEQTRFDAQQTNEPMANDRLEQFQQLRGETEQGDSRFPSAKAEPTQPSDQQQQSQQQEQQQQPHQAQPTPQSQQPQEPLSLTEQVQKAASAKQSPAPAQSAWAKVNTDLPQPFPPAPSQSPLPAPAAQRTSRQSVADHLHQESRSRSQTPSVDTPSTAVAPWAKEPAEALKGPSLKEIQEAEAKVAAQNEELAAAARRSAAQREMEAQAQAQQATPALGLPASSKWATGAAGSPSTPTAGGASPWGAKVVHKAATPATTKSMAQIQKEEEARKTKLAAAAAAKAPPQSQNVPPPAAAGAGKSYANLAGKVNMPPPGAGSAWTTVGASGKAKTPAPAPTPLQRAPSAANLQPAPQPKKVPSRSSTMTNTAGVNAQEEFRKWAVNELRPDLTKGISADDFVAQLVFLPPDGDIITEAVHSSSNTIDSRHFAEEFIRRKRLADKGLLDTSAPTKTSSPANAGDAKGGGWSEVAKKGPVREGSNKEESSAPGNGAFRVVPAKKKGGKR